MLLLVKFKFFLHTLLPVVNSTFKKKKPDTTVALCKLGMTVMNTRGLKPQENRDTFPTVTVYHFVWFKSLHCSQWRQAQEEDTRRREHRRKHTNQPCCNWIVMSQSYIYVILGFFPVPQLSEALKRQATQAAVDISFSFSF